MMRATSFLLVLLLVLSTPIFGSLGLHSANASGNFSTPLQLSNNQPLSTPAPFQQQIVLNNSIFGQYESTDLGNVRFYSDQAQNVPLNSWLESVNSTSAMFWVKLPNGIPANSNITIFLSFLVSTTEFDGVIAGEAPQLSPSYGQYDNGANVFSLYDNFKGTSLNTSIWNNFGSQGQAGSLSDISVNNGLTTFDPSGTFYGQATWISSSLPTAQLTKNLVADFYSKPSQVRPSGAFAGRFGFESIIPNNLGEGSGIGTDMAYQPSSPALATCTSGACSEALFAPGPYTQNYNVYTIAYSDSEAKSYLNYTNVATSTSNVPAHSSTMTLFQTNNFDGMNLYTTWARIREYPTGGSMPVITISNNGPTLGPINSPINPILINSAFTVNATFSDIENPDTYVVTWNWNDGTNSTSTVTSNTGSGLLVASHAYSAPGVYTITLSVSDDGSIVSEQSTSYVVAYDPNGGFITGGGWINSPLGAYSADPSLTGKATFGFVAKYQNGANVPSGNTQFNFQVAGLNFHSTSYQWLVISSAKAQYKGSGTINNAGNYGFMLTAIDGAQNGGGGVDKFRMKIFDSNGGLIYDNLLNAPDSSDPTTVLGGGDIVIHKQ